mmetsp:Transcript_54154/g.62278  ORF Transcript_54154/g.62278 Transcript_54154/m.62278 type:complete len:118 (-) Transcript_54154:40-393(-)
MSFIHCTFDRSSSENDRSSFESRILARVRGEVVSAITIRRRNVSTFPHHRRIIVSLLAPVGVCCCVAVGGVDDEQPCQLVVRAPLHFSTPPTEHGMHTLRNVAVDKRSVEETDAIPL